MSINGEGATKDAFRPVVKQNLADRLARRIHTMIQEGEFREGDRLPAIMEMARRFGVGHPSLREALKKLETMGVVEIRHGSGVYVTRSQDVLLVAAPEFTGTLTKKLLIDLLETRMPLEMQSVALAARNADDQNIADMRSLLDTASQNLADDSVLNQTNMSFHRAIAQASGNAVLTQLLSVLHELFADEQRLILGIFGSRDRDHLEHLGILDALEQRDETLAVERMKAHLQGVENAIQGWNPEHHPIP
jgi:GntR family transcriptional repressor for pyruvate dehydrogenase complex